MPEPSGEPQWGPATTYRARRRRGDGHVPPPDGDRRGAAPSPARRPAGDGGQPRPPRQPRGASTAGPVPRRRRRRPGLRALLVVLLLVLVAYPLALGLTGYLAVNRAGDLPSSGLDGTPGRTTLLVGSDSREGLTAEQRNQLRTGSTEGRRTDTILLLHTPRGGGPAVLVSIPRDSYVDIPGRGENKINAAFAFGGPELLVQTVEGATDLAVDGYVETGLGGFAALVDAVGGVEQCPETAIDDPKAGLDVEAGCQEMDGATALGYARSRDFDPRGDLGRADRQRDLISAIISKAASPATLVNPFRAFPAAKAAGGALTVDDGTGPVDMARFALGMRAASSPDGVQLTVPVADTSRRTGAGLVVDWDTDAAEQLFAALRRDDTSAVRDLVPTAG